VSRAAAALLMVVSGAALLPGARAQAAALNIAALSCAAYENEVLASTTTGQALDPIDTVMWLFGYSVARSGERNMYSDSLPAFGFALDAECKTHPAATLSEAVTKVKSKRDNPMDLTKLSCTMFEKRHTALRQSDPESARTLAMWLYGFAVGTSDGHVLDPASLDKFESGLADHCTTKPDDTLFDALIAGNPAVPRTPARKK
jgi:HdeA/HdeB family